MAISTAFIVGCIGLSIPLYIGFASSILLTALVLLKSGFSLRELCRTLVSAAMEVRHLCLVIILIGATTSIWLMSGVVPTIMYYGFSYMEGINFMMAAFLIMVLVSVFMGTAVGTVSTVGIALLGIGRGLGIPAEVIVGVLVSGAFIADKVSPISGLVNLTMVTVGKSYAQVVKGFLPTLLPLVAITAVIYFIMGLNYTSGDYSRLAMYRDAISAGINVSPVLMILPVLVVVLSVLGVNSTLTIGIGLVCGGIFSVTLQHMGVLSVIRSVIFGFQGATASAELNAMLVSGGVVSMIEVILIVVGGVMLVRLFENYGILMPLIDRMMSGVKTRMSLIVRTGIVSSLLTIVTCDQTVGIILPGRVLQGKYREMGLDMTVLARTISDTGTIIAPLMAWNVNSFIIKSIIGIDAGGYAPYAVLCYICPAIALIYSFFKYGLRQSDSTN